MIHSIHLKLPSPLAVGNKDKVHLLCTKPRNLSDTERSPYCSDTEDDEEDHEETDEIVIEGTKNVTQMQVCKVLYDGTPSSKRVMIFSCKFGDGSSSPTVCLKLMDNNDIYQNEKGAYENMLKPTPGCDDNSDASKLFLKVFFFCEVIMPDNRAWKGYCMQEAKYSVREILTPSFSDPVAGALAQRKILQYVLQEKEKALKEGTTPSAADDGGGVLVEYRPNQSIQLSIAIATLRLMHQLHSKHGWVHGDSHMGNFMYMNRKVYAIDFERSFPSIDPVQHLLDLQEFFGHFSGILLNPLRVHEWDMRDIFGLYYLRHPLLRQGTSISTSSNFSRRKVMYMLPICTCFTCPTAEMREKGCQFCKSQVNVQSAQYVAENFENVMEDLSDWGLIKMKNGLSFTRSHSIMKQCCSIADIIYPCIQDGSVLRMRLDPELLIHSDSEEEDYYSEEEEDVTPSLVMIRHGRKRKYVEIEEQQRSLLNTKLINDITKSKQQCVVVLKRLLYMPAVSKKANNIVKEIVCRLKKAGFVHAANMMWTNTAAYHHCASE